MSKHNLNYILSLSLFLVFSWIASLQVEVASAQGTISEYPPTAPDFWFNGDHSSKTSVLFEWSQVDGAGGYRIYEKQGEKFVLLADVGPSVKSWNWEKLECSKVYEFVVNAYNGNGESTPTKIGEAFTWLCDCADRLIQNPGKIGLYKEPLCRDLGLQLGVGTYGLSELGYDDSVQAVVVPSSMCGEFYQHASLQGMLSRWWNITMWFLHGDFFWNSDVTTLKEISSVRVFDNEQCAATLIFLPVIAR